MHAAEPITRHKFQQPAVQTGLYHST